VTQEPPPTPYQPQSTYTEYRQGASPQTPSPGQRVPINTPQTRPIVTYTLLAITILIFLLQNASMYLTGGADLVANLGLKVNELIGAGQYWRLITPMFLHASLLHLGFNMYALLIFGPGLERFYGHFRFLVLYLLGGFAGNVISFMFSPANSLGSSTAIFGLLGAEGVFLYRNQGVFGGMARRALGNIVLIAAINLVIGLSPGIDNWGHMGGLIGGTLFAWLGGPLLRIEGIYPNVSVVDGREIREVYLAALVEGILFGFLAVFTIYLRGGNL
jgi:rhomboid protease GluP